MKSLVRNMLGVTKARCC